MECPEHHPVPDRDKAIVSTSCHCDRTKCKDHVFFSRRACAEEINIALYFLILHPYIRSDFLKCKVDDARMWSKIMPGTRYYVARLVCWLVSLALEAGNAPKTHR